MYMYATVLLAVFHQCETFFVFVLTIAGYPFSVRHHLYQQFHNVIQVASNAIGGKYCVHNIHVHVPYVQYGLLYSLIMSECML